MPHPAGELGIPRLQIAFQGGGAKFVSLMAAAHAFKEAHDSSIIKITRVSGTSAGSIIAALIASGANFDKASEFLSLSGKKHISALTRGRALSSKLAMVRLAVCGWSGKPLFDQNAFNLFLAALIQESVGSVPPSIQSACDTTGIGLVITVSDVRESVARRLRSDAPLIQSIADSCAIPLFFRGYKDLAVNPFVDGGLCENLPVECLLDDAEEEGEVFAVTPCVQSSSNPSINIFSYLARLFDVSIDNSVKRSRLLVSKDKLVEVKTEIGTFDFDSALTKLAGSAEYKLVKADTTRKIQDYVANYKVNRHRSPTVKDIKEELSVLKGTLLSIYKVAFSRATLVPIRTSMTVYAESLDELRAPKDRRPDVVRREVIYRIGPEPIHSIIVQMEADGNAVSPRPLKHSVQRAVDGNILASHIVAVEAEPIGQSKRRVIQCLIFLEQPIEALSGSEEIIVRWDYQVSDCMMPLSATGSDELSIRNPRNSKMAIADIILMVPSSFRYDIKQIFEKNVVSNRCRKLNSHEVSVFYPGLDTVNYAAFGARAEEIPAGDRFVIEYFVDRNDAR